MPEGTQRMVARPSELKGLGKSRSLQVSWCWGPQFKASSWECSLLGPSPEVVAKAWMSVQGRSLEVVRHKPLSVCSGTFHSNSQPKRPALLKVLDAGGPELGMKKCCRLVDISCNYNLYTRAYWYLHSHGLLLLLLLSHFSRVRLCASP